MFLSLSQTEIRRSDGNDGGPITRRDNLVALLFPFSLYILYHDFDNFSNYGSCQVLSVYGSCVVDLCTIRLDTTYVHCGRLIRHRDELKKFDKRKNLICWCVGARYNFSTPQISYVSHVPRIHCPDFGRSTYSTYIYYVYLLRTEGKARCVPIVYPLVYPLCYSR